jgi:aspartate/methionine/tyrosine aminotransferase
MIIPNPKNDRDGSDGYDGSGDSANDIENNNDIVITISNQSEIEWFMIATTNHGDYLVAYQPVYNGAVN